MREDLKRFFELLDEIAVYRRALGKINFDMNCLAPKEAMDEISSDIAVLGKHLYKLSHSEEYISLLTALHADQSGLTKVQKKAVEHLYEDYLREKNVTPEFSYECDLEFSKAYGAWLEAKEKSDYSLFKESFAKIIELTRRSIDLREDKKDGYYATLLDDYEKDGNKKQLDEFFSSLKNTIVPLVARIQTEGKPIREDFLSRPCPIAKQEEFSRYLMDVQGLRPTALVFATTEHPFTDNFGPHDVRVTTHFYEDNFVSNIFSTLHEGGHAMFMQNEPDEMHENHNADRMSSAMHECISRFYENIIGRSPEFIHFVYPKFKELGKGIFDDVSERELYEAVNIAKPSLIRVEADELTYSIHIMIRYELEKLFVDGKISVDEIPALWNAKYKEYLGVDVPDDASGCLQDVHWSGSYGYFPSYALGNAYGAQILKTMEKDFDVFASVKKGDLSKIAEWLKERVYKKASMLTPDEWIRDITGEGLNVKYYLDYLTEKYTKLYELK